MNKLFGVMRLCIANKTYRTLEVGGARPENCPSKTWTFNPYLRILYRFSVESGHFQVSLTIPNQSTKNRAMRVHRAMCFRNPRYESGDSKALEGTKTSDLCSAMCSTENHIRGAMHCHCDLCSCYGNPLRRRPRCKHHSECDAALW